MRVIGLTGSIGAGKSTVAGWLCELGAATIDADALVRRLYASDADLIAQLASRFGPEFVTNGRVDRPALGRVVFSDPAKLAVLEAVVHPAVQRLRDEEIAAARARGEAVCVLEAIKLIESGASARCDELWIVVAAEPVQLARLAGRGIPEPEARRRIAAQGTIASWLAAFHAESVSLAYPRPVIVFDNSGTLDQGRTQAHRLWHGIARQKGQC